ncbi:glycosyl hydrolase 53 family protein [Paenibacillus lemnae]|uniref:Arabinogalactan endo-beta-1,4-galactanase n=1 Tax=Paenibacillus lemnae TaxID=1330551 RepID=A0A848M1G3_PAELE|nr:glycosyl hydrolase 53 family protein [Paenibacillus lemnae]NMO94386.1 hypothetical protein [Paenibacillus lemnae]
MHSRKRTMSALLVMVLLVSQFIGYPAPAAAAEVVNLAYLKTVTASSVNTSHPEQHAVDGKTDTRWEASGAINGSDAWLMVDLGKLTRLSGTEITWGNQPGKWDSGPVKYRVEVSADGSDWRVASDQSSNTLLEQTARNTFEETDVRYVRISIPFYIGTTWWPAIQELKVWGEAVVKPPSDIISYNPVQVTTPAGIPPVLPAQVTATYSTYTPEQVDVVWSPIDPAQYSTAGVSFAVQGTVEGASVQPSATVEVQGYREDFIRGVDISTLTAIEDNGGRYYDSNGVERDLLDILKDRGVNYVRLRVWNDPNMTNFHGDQYYNNKDDVIRLGKRVKQKGMNLLVDFHYSDEWAHPGQQIKPKAWKNFTHDELKDALQAYTTEVIQGLKDAGAMPDMVQIGNEINSGLLNDKNSVPDFDKTADYITSGVAGVRAVSGSEDVKIMIHLAEGGRYDTFNWFFSELKSRHVEYDIIGLSYYPFWHGTFADIQNTMDRMSSEYGKEVIIAETSYPFSFKNGDAHANVLGSTAQLIGGATFPATVQGQFDATKAVMDALADVPDGKGLGFFYWEPAWIAANVGWIDSEGDAWENQAMFNYDEFPGNGGYSYKGYALPSLDAFKVGMTYAPANRMELEKWLNKAKLYTASDVDASSWQLLQDGIAAAQISYNSVYTQNRVTQSDIDTAVADLSAIIAGLQIISVNKESLQAAIAEAQGKQQSDWSAYTWTQLQKALQAALDVLNDAQAPQAEVDHTLSALRTALEALSNIDKTELANLIASVRVMDDSSYTQRSWAYVQAALVAAIEVNDRQTVDQEQVELALAELQTALRSLVQLQQLAAGKTAEASTSAGTGGGKSNAPAGAVDDNPNTSWGTDQGAGSWWKVDLGDPALIRKIQMKMWSGGIKFKIEVSDDDQHYVEVADTTSDVIVSTDPKIVFPSPVTARYIKVTITEAQTIWVGMMDFSAQGVFPADKTALSEKITDAERQNLKVSDYTSSSWEAFQTAWSHAGIIMEDGEASTSDIEAAAAALTAALDGLTRRSEQPDTEEPAPDPGPIPGPEPVPGPQPGPSTPAVPSIPPVTAAPPSPSPGDSGSTVTLTGTLESGTYRAAASLASLSAAAEAATDEEVKLLIAPPAGAANVAVQIPAAWLKELKNHVNVKFVRIQTPEVSIRLSADLIHGQVTAASQLNLILGKVNHADLPAAAQRKLARQAAYDFQMTLDGRNLEWQGSQVEVSMPFTLQPGQKASGIVIYHVTADGQFKAINHVRYDAQVKTVSFKAPHFSMYTALYEPVRFTDIARYAWAEDQIEGLVAKGIIQGMSTTEFAPQKQVSRAQFIQMLMHALGLVQTGAASSFTDVQADIWYHDAAASAQQLGIVQGKPDGSFSGQEPITRQDMAVMLNKAVTMTGLTLDDQTAEPAVFKDAGQISLYASDAVSTIQRAGIIAGMGNGTFAPKEHATRAQAAVIISSMLTALYER